MNDLADARVLDEVVGELPRSERERLYAERKEHKEVVVFLTSGRTPSAPSTWQCATT